ncbi:MAG: DNA polymerase IV [Candidatus Wildermuthbacteria bacterium]|nr:DNA polymerase IV [Candidatus Wildermuthbacteria bacterium]
MDAFFASIEERENPRFRGKPLVVGAEPLEGRGVVSTANYEARKYGIHSGMPISKAYQLCPTAIFLPVNGSFYAKVSEGIMDIVRHMTGEAIEQVSMDEAYIDLSGIGQWEKAEEIAKKLRREVFEKEKLPCTCGIGPNKMMAKIACELAKPSFGRAKPNGLKLITDKEAEAVLEPLDIEVIPGIGKKSGAMLKEKGIRTVGDAKTMPVENLKNLFGIRGEALYDRLRGIDEDAVETEREIKSIGKEHTFQEDTRDPELLLFVFDALLNDVWSELKAANMECKTVTVVFRMKGFETHTKSKTIESSRDLALLRREAVKLLLRFMVSYSLPIRLIGVRLSIVPRRIS